MTGLDYIAIGFYLGAIVTFGFCTITHEIKLTRQHKKVMAAITKRGGPGLTAEQEARLRASL